MVAWRHPELGLIEWLPVDLQPEKVWKHFYCPAEHWERISPLDPRVVSKEAADLVGAEPGTVRELPRVEAAGRQRAKAILCLHHDRGYGPAYYVQMKDTGTIWAPRMDRRHRHAALSPDSVILVVQLAQPSLVLTAFRPHPPTLGVRWSEDDFRTHARWKFMKDTGMSTKDALVRALISRLERCDKLPIDDASGAWELASALGFARLLAPTRELSEALKRAEDAWKRVPEPAKAELVSVLDWEGSLDAVAAGLKDNRPEELENALSTFEDLLAVGDVLGVGHAAESYLQRAEELLAWTPAEWDHLLDAAALRRTWFEGAGSHPALLWLAVESGIAGALVRETAAQRRPAATIVDSLLPEPVEHWQTRVAAVAKAGASLVAGLAERLLGQLDLREPAPAMGGGESDSHGAWELFAPAGRVQEHARMFVVDTDYPDGYEVTEAWLAQDACSVWRFERCGQEALVVVVVGAGEVQGETLNEVLESAVKEGWVVGSRKLSRPR